MTGVISLEVIWYRVSLQFVWFYGDQCWNSQRICASLIVWLKRMALKWSKITYLIIALQKGKSAQPKRRPGRRHFNGAELWTDRPIPFREFNFFIHSWMRDVPSQMFHPKYVCNTPYFVGCIRSYTSQCPSKNWDVQGWTLWFTTIIGLETCPKLTFWLLYTNEWKIHQN